MNKTDLIQQISQLITAARKEKGWSKSDLAKACLKHRQAITKWESGTVTPSIYVLYEIAEAMDIPLSKLTDIDTLKQDDKPAITDDKNLTVT